MTDFIKAFKDGLEAAEASELARRQINGIFDELNHQMDKETAGNILISRKKLQVKRSIFDFSVVPKFYWAIVAYNPKITGSPLKELAKWNEDRTGFPCKIEWGNVAHTCEDKESLESSLAELLRDPVIGEILYALTKLEPNKQDEDPSPE